MNREVKAMHEEEIEITHNYRRIVRQVVEEIEYLVSDLEHYECMNDMREKLLSKATSELWGLEAMLDSKWEHHAIILNDVTMDELANGK